MPETGHATRVAVVGDATSVAGFRPLGFAVFTVEHPADARDVWDELVGGGYAVVLVTEAVFEELEDLAAGVTDEVLPAVTVIPGAGGSRGLGEQKLARSIERALGTSTLMGEEEE